MALASLSATILNLRAKITPRHANHNLTEVNSGHLLHCIGSEQTESNSKVQSLYAGTIEEGSRADELAAERRDHAVDTVLIDLAGRLDQIDDPIQPAQRWRGH
jgi:hypothetical protein